MQKGWDLPSFLKEENRKIVIVRREKKGHKGIALKITTVKLSQVSPLQDASTSNTDW